MLRFTESKRVRYTECVREREEDRDVKSVEVSPAFIAVIRGMLSYAVMFVNTRTQ